MKSFNSMLSVLLVAMLVMVPAAFALDTSAQVKITNVGDPCQNPNVAKSSAVISVGSATTSSIVSGTVGQYIHVCSVSATLIGTSTNLSTARLVSGSTTTTDCDTSAANLTGAFSTGKLASFALSGTTAFDSTGVLSYTTDSTGGVISTSSGTLATTATGTVTGTGTFTGTMSSGINIGGGYTALKLAIGKNLCTTTTGTGVGLYGVLTYVKQ